ncbi:TetR/AcrR family transcriptional regulator [Actinophytocola sediminis]
MSNRQISEAAEQGNTAAVNYHFGTKTELVRAIVRQHDDELTRLRERMVDQAGDSTDTTDWVGCLVRPITEHLENLGGTTWFGRFTAQLLACPQYGEIMVEEAIAQPAMLATLDGLNRCLPDLPAPVRAERGDMARYLITYTIADRERAIALGQPTPRPSWSAAATGLIEAVVGLWHAPSSG